MISVRINEYVKNYFVDGLKGFLKSRKVVWYGAVDRVVGLGRLRQGLTLGGASERCGLHLSI